MGALLMRSFLLLSLFAFVGTQARTLLDHCNEFKAEKYVGRRPKTTPPAPFSSPPTKEVSKFLPNNMVKKPNSNPVSKITSKNKQTMDSLPNLQNYGRRPNRPPPSPVLPPPTHQLSSNVLVMFKKSLPKIFLSTA
ncbi:uncharacterized protein LOC111371872 [Olea europaea var. sylvestris]|uniref:uncharacterized protein LOC111371872 n=1 Tax=Olea europaea var. sylvestris TaxID=158386 RepID=UPI000C1CE977|nr:uncharacterized protein LOC111371872 [Olea europaea var. sylvestris]